jgi:predicted permease
MSNIILLPLCIVLGVIMRSTRRVPDDAHLSINAFVIHVALPALILTQIHGIHLERSLLLSVGMPWLLFIVGGGLIWLAGRVSGLSLSTIGALILTACLANTSFIGLPMIETFYGAHYMAVGLLIDQLGSYLVLSTLGITIAAVMASGAAPIREIARRMLTFPPLIALLVAFLSMPVSYPVWLTEILLRLGGTLVPLALVSVGLQLRPGLLRERIHPLMLGLGFKLVLAPLLLAVLYVGVLGSRGIVTRVTLFEAAMGPMIGGAIVAAQYGLDAPLVTLMVSVGSIASFVTLPFWWYLLQGA